MRKLSLYILLFFTAMVCSPVIEASSVPGNTAISDLEEDPEVNCETIAGGKSETIAVTKAAAYEAVMSEIALKEHLKALTDSLSLGRGSGTSGASHAREYITERYQEYGLEPLGIGGYSHNFKVKDLNCANIVGLVSSTERSEKYVVIGAHYDHLGIIKGIVYPGADDNASGVAALLELAKAFAMYKQDGNPLPVNLIFVAFDAHEQSLAGSRNFFTTTRIKPYTIDFMVNIDQIGSVLSPVHPGLKNYLLVLGQDKFQDWIWENIELSNKLHGINLDLDYSFYGSEQFYKLFYRLSEQADFVVRAVPSAFFTSGVTQLTNKPSDTEANINYEALRKRLSLIYYFIYNQIL